MVEIEKSRSPPSFSAYGMRSFSGQRGHGVTSSGRATRRLADELDLRDRRAPSRCEFATQSAPVSPPPITTTCLPAAVIDVVARGRRRSAGVVPAPSSRATKRLRW